MRILIVNDDGIFAPGIIALANWAKQYGDVTLVAPKVEQSGKSHSIEIHKPFEVKHVDFPNAIEAYTVDSAPSDCVRIALLYLKKEFDLVISGITRGLNLGIDIFYSGTAAGLFEAGCFGVPAIALSTEPSTYEEAIANLDVIKDFFLEHKLLEKHNLYNVNIPLGNKGIRITRTGGRYFSDDFFDTGNDMISPKGVDVFEPCGREDVDTDAVLYHKYISITPLTVNRTQMDAFDSLSKLNP